MATPLELLGTLEDLTEGEFKKFKWFLQQAEILDGFPAIPKSQLENADRLDAVDQIADAYHENVLEVIVKVLKRINKNDMVQRLSKVNSASKENLSVCQRKLKLSLRKKLQHLFTPAANCGKQMFLSGLYTAVDIAEVKPAKDNQNITQTTEDSTKTFNPGDYFSKASPAEDVLVRTLMTTGAVGVGKTVLTQKFVLDWTEDKVNDIQFIFPFTFQELNLHKEKKFSWVELLRYFFPDTKDLGIDSFDDLQVLFVFDGLDECQLPLDFSNNQTLNDVAESAPVDVLLTNLVTGKLFPSARVWVTTTPEAAHRIPPEYVHNVTEVTGFSDSKKDEYLRKRFRDKELSSRIISYIKATQSLYIRCHIPVYCWICATVLEDVLQTTETVRVPKTQTEMYLHFLVLHFKLASVTYDGDAEKTLCRNKETISKTISLGKLAFKQLLQGNSIFSEADLKECGINSQIVSTYSGLLTQTCSEVHGLSNGKLYNFVHSSFQKFLAAVYVAVSFINSGVNLLSKEKLTSQASSPTMGISEVNALYQTAIDRALQSPNGHLDLFLRFFIGLSLQTNQTVLKELLKLPGRRSFESKHDIVQYIKWCVRETPSPERCSNLFHCLNELNEASVAEEIQWYLCSGRVDVKWLSPAHYSELVSLLLSSQSELDVFDLRKYSASEEGGPLWLLPVIQASSLCRLSSCELSQSVWKSVATAFNSPSSNVKVLDLSYSHLGCAMQHLVDAWKGSPCTLEALRLIGCDLICNTAQNCAALSSLLSSKSSRLRELDLTNNDLQGRGVEELSVGLRSPHCKLQTLRLISCGLTWKNCDAVGFFLSSKSSGLLELDLSLNSLEDSGVRVFCPGLRSPHCKLQTLRLSLCDLTEKSCEVLASALSSDSSSFRVLDLSNNNLRDSGVKLLLAALKRPNCKLDVLRLSDCKLSGRICEEFASALRSQTSRLKQLDLSDNDLTDSGVKVLCGGLESPRCRLETLKLSACLMTEDGCTFLASALSQNPSHLRELDLSYNHPGDGGVKVLSAGLDDPLWRLSILRTDHGGATRLKSGVWKYSCKLTLDPNTAHRKLMLRENNTTVELVETLQPYPYHPERFTQREQVMCTSGLTGRCYWEVEFRGCVDVAVTYFGIGRRDDNHVCTFGMNDKSWCFSCSGAWGLSVQHKNKKTLVCSTADGVNRVGVCLDFCAGFLSFYQVSSDTLTHLHTVYATFTEPLYPAFRLHQGSRLSICP